MKCPHKEPRIMTRIDWTKERRQHGLGLFPEGDHLLAKLIESSWVQCLNKFECARHREPSAGIMGPRPIKKCTGRLLVGAGLKSMANLNRSQVMTISRCKANEGSAFGCATPFVEISNVKVGIQLT